MILFFSQKFYLLISQLTIEGHLGKINPKDAIMGYLNRKGKRSRKHLSYLTLMAQVLKLSAVVFVIYFIFNFQ